ncbi:MAG: DUF2953 domain-containing protein [Clostridia bacterium]|nr:DUF2953 domain-containing protein [Clostridia bacterium]
MKTLLIIFIVLMVIALLPLGVDGGLRGNTLSISVKIGFFNIKLLPKMKKQLKAGILKKLKKTYDFAEQDEKKQKKGFETERMLAIIKPALKALGRFRRKLTVEYLRIHCTVATGDPAGTAIAYGIASSAMGTVIPLVDSAFDIRNRDVGVSFDFLSDSAGFDFWLTATVQVWEIIYIAAAFGIDILKQKRKERKARIKERNDLNGQTSDR